MHAIISYPAVYIKFTSMRTQSTAKNRLITPAVKEDFKKRVLSFAGTIKGGVSKEYMNELEKHQKEAEFIEHNL